MLERLEAVRVVPEHGVGACVDRGVGAGDVVSMRGEGALDSPVDRDEDQVGPRSPADRGAAAAVLTILSFAGARFKASRRFRYVTMAAAAHLVILSVLTFFVIPSKKDIGDYDVHWTVDGAENTIGDPDLPDEGALPPASDVETVAQAPIESILPPTEAMPRPDLGEGGPGETHRPMRILRRFPTDAVASYLSIRLDPSRKEKHLRDARGDLRTLIAIRKAFASLAKTQQKDGSWAPGKGYEGYREGVTGLALLAFLADGHSVHRGDHRAVVAKAVAFLRRQQHDGMIADPTFDRPMMGHAIATLALLEVWGTDYEHMRGGRISLRRDIRDAVRVIVEARKSDGGWRYQPRRNEDDSSKSDVSVSVWQVLALGLARDAGFPVPTRILTGARDFLTSRIRTADGAVGDHGVPGAEEALNPTLTAGALLIAPDLKTDNAIAGRQRATIRAAVPGKDAPRDPLLWFYATQGLRRLGDRGHAAWSRHTTAILLDAQRIDGSWSPDALHGQQGGSAFTTALGALILSVDFRDGRSL